MPRSPVDPEQMGQMIETGSALKKLTEYPEWQILERVMNDRQQAHLSKMTRELMRGRPPDTETVLRQVGYWQGVMAVLKTPHAVTKQLEKMLETANSAQQEGAP